MNLVKIDTSFLAALLLIGTALLVRASIQGFVPALLSTAIEWRRNRVRAGVGR